MAVLGVHCRAGFSLLRRAGTTVHCGVRASCCYGLSLAEQRLQGVQTSVAAAHGPSSCGSQARARGDQWLWYTSLDAVWRAGSSRTRAWTCVFCIGSWILYHWVTTVPMQYCSLQHQTLIPQPVTSRTRRYFCCGSVSSFFLESRQPASGQTGDGKSEHQYFRNQLTQMDWNGWIQLKWPLYLLLCARIL